MWAFKLSRDDRDPVLRPFSIRMIGAECGGPQFRDLSKFGRGFLKALLLVQHMGMSGECENGVRVANDL